MRRNSIAINVFLFSVAWLVVALAATAFLLTGLYARALETSLDETIEFQVQTLVGVALTDGLDSLNGYELGDPRFSRPASGWYWEVRNEAGDDLAFSASLIGSVLPDFAPLDVDNIGTKRAVDNFGTQISVLRREILLGDEKYIFTATGNLDEIWELVAGFRGQTFVVLGAVGAMLAGMSALVARFALRPVTQLRSALERVREGEAERVDGVFPTELEPLSAEVNELLRSNAQIIERARSHVGNLAHGMKTPIAVMRNEAEGKNDAVSELVLVQTRKMTDLVSAYLDRAQLAARTAVVGRKTDTGQTVTKLVRVMQKIHRNREINLSIQETGAPWFRGEESDLEEMLGNLLDNACKWANHNVSIDVQTNKTTNSGLTIVIQDDGRGLTSAECEKVLKRGVRLDEKTPGSGLGLDIVKELVDVYGGSLQLGRAKLGGLEIRLELPAAKAR